MIRESACRIKSNTQIAKDIYLLTLENKEIARNSHSGQFAMVEVPGKFLRRPLCIADISENKEEFSLLYAVVGEGTAALAKVQAGENLNIVAPLGNGFSVPQCKKVLVVAGGLGAATAIELCKELSAKDNEINICLGFRNAEMAIPAEFFPIGANLQIATEDGSLGIKGFVTGILPTVTDFDEVYMCGPMPMYKAMAPLLWSSTVTYPPVYASFEARMGCGYGVCVGCSVKVDGRNKKVCTDGPVFNFHEVDFESFAL